MLPLADLFPILWIMDESPLTPLCSVMTAIDRKPAIRSDAAAIDFIKVGADVRLNGLPILTKRAAIETR